MPLWVLAVGVAIMVALAFAASQMLGPASERVQAMRRALASGDEISQLLAEGKKIEAIKLVRERTGLGLKEAKDLVERVEQLGGTALPAGARVEAAGPTPSPEAMAEIRALLAAGNKIEAIKLYRAQTGLGLAEAKAAIDSLE